jgi:hypothetical protein
MSLGRAYLAAPLIASLIRSVRLPSAWLTGWRG